MGCLCNELAGPGVEVSPTCIGHLWVFEHLKPEEMAALAKAAERKPYQKVRLCNPKGPGPTACS